jgi:predicted HTH transcriptional regulator
VIEFKSTGRLNTFTGDKDPAVEWSLLKTIAAFANAYGGRAIVGVADPGTVVGIEGDLPFVHKHDLDGRMLWFTTAVADSMGKLTAADLDIQSATIEGKLVLKIDVGPASKPVFGKSPKEPKPVFMTRLGNAAHELSGQELLDYQQQRWPTA